jgi:hypothetical protein
MRAGATATGVEVGVGVEVEVCVGVGSAVIAAASSVPALHPARATRSAAAPTIAEPLRRLDICSPSRPCAHAYIPTSNILTCLNWTVADLPRASPMSPEVNRASDSGEKSAGWGARVSLSAFDG